MTKRVCNVGDEYADVVTCGICCDVMHNATSVVPCMHNYSSHLCNGNASTVFGYSCLTDVPQKGKGGLLWESVGATVFTTFDLDF